MHTLYNTKTDKDINFPSDIEELSPSQYLAYIKLIYQAEMSKMTISDLRSHILQIVCPIRFGFGFVKMSKSEKDALWQSLYQWSELLDSFFDIELVDNKKIYKAHLKSGVNLLPSWNKYVGPDDMLNNITWGEFVSCMNLLNQYKQAVEASDTSLLASILSDLFYVLYKPTKKRKKRIEVPIYVKYHVFYFFSNVLDLITSIPIPIHGSAIDFSILFSDKASTPKDNKMGWNGLVFAVAESGVFGRTEDVNNQPFWSVLLYLYKCAFDNQSLNDKK